MTDDINAEIRRQFALSRNRFVPPAPPATDRTSDTDINAEIRQQFEVSRSRLSVTKPTPANQPIDTTTPTDDERLNNEARALFERRNILNRLLGRGHS